MKINHALKAAPKGLKAINTIYEAQVKQKIIHQFVQQTFVKAAESNDKKSKLSAINKNLSVVKDKIPKGFYNKTKLGIYPQTNLGGVS